jgi:hypothetical protein
MTIIDKMTLDECLWARAKEEIILDKMLIQTPKVSMNNLLEQERKLESLDYWIERKRIVEAAECS